MNLFELQTKWWYRLLKVIYVLLYMYGAFLTIVVFIETGTSYNQWTYKKEPFDTNEAFIYAGLVALGFLFGIEFIRRSFYYVMIGKIFPAKDS